ncbi:cobyric acid synthase [Magnetovibrio sp.]|uniref:cobyric acid synthase n=1 Tax=Magnetovibrio sp. TaxID=2024836 RepID=UPI002F959F9F
MPNKDANCRAIMVQGTGSDAGKSLIVAGLCRAFVKRGLRVRPFKPQNMSNNAAVTEDGGEIGRAQALQARACVVAPHTDMNPVLLKPEGENGAQLVVGGRMRGHATAQDFRTFKETLLPEVIAAFERLKSQCDLVIVEGAGSPSEVNLRVGDIANMGFAQAADVPVILAGDIEKGGVIAQVVGTHAVLMPSEQARIKGFVINKFRGDISLFEPALSDIEARTGWSALGVVPWFVDAGKLPKEDSASMGRWAETGRGDGMGRIRVAVPRLPRIANFDDLDPLMAEDDVDVMMIEPGQAIPGDVDVVVLPGSKSVISDLRAAKAEDWDVDIAAHVHRGGLVVGLCGGYQMLGQRIADPDGIEGEAGEELGLGLLDVETVLTGDKTLEHVEGREAATGINISGYEMHIGLTEGPARLAPWFHLGDGREEGARSSSQQVMGTYLHGVFASDAFRHDFLSRLREGRSGGAAYEHGVEQALDDLAAHLESCLDLDALLNLAQ